MTEYMFAVLSKNVGNDAVYFSTAQYYDNLGYLPVVAKIHDDCSLTLRLPYNGAQYIMVGILQLACNSTATDIALGL